MNRSPIRSSTIKSLIICIVSVVTFSNTLDYGYVWDDRIVITENPYVLSGLEGLPKIWVKQHSDLLHDQVGYRPLTFTTFALEQEFYPNQPHIGHWVNVLLYALLSLAILWFSTLAIQSGNSLIPFLITLLFVVHPLHVEVVANIKSRDEILQLLFGILSVISFVRWLEKRKVFLFILSACLLILSVLSKENGITFVGVMAIIWLVRTTGWRITRKKVFTVLSLGLFLGVCASLILFGLSGDEGMEKTEGLGIFYESRVLGDCFRQTRDWWTMFVNKNLLIYRYLAKFFYPVNLTYFSGFDQIPMYTPKSVQSVLGMVVSVGFFGVLVWTFLKNRNVFLGLGFFLITLSPFLHIIVPMPDTMADRFMFTPSLGLCMVSVILCNQAIDRFNLTNARKLASLVVLMTVVASLLAYTAWNRNKVWSSNLALFQADISKLENCAKAHEFLADALHLKMNQTGNTDLIPEIVSHYERSISISELSYYSFMKLGSNYSNWGNPDRGLELLQRAAELFPEQADPHFYLGSELFRRGRFEEAIPHFQTSMVLSPKVSDSYYLLAKSELALDSVEFAQESAEIGIQLFPTEPLIRDVLVDALIQKGDTSLAFQHLDTILIQNPQSAVFWKKAIGLRQSFGLKAKADSIYLVALQQGVQF